LKEKDRVRPSVAAVAGADQNAWGFRLLDPRLELLGAEREREAVELLAGLLDDAVRRVTPMAERKDRRSGLSSGKRAPKRRAA
jgi:hypothetical protein